MRGDGRVFRRGRFPWIAYCLHGKEQRESAAKAIAEVTAKKRRALTDDEAKQVAEKFLEKRLREKDNDRDGIKAFVGPQQDKLSVGQLLDTLEADFKLRNLKSLSQTLGHLGKVREYFGDLRAVNVSTETITKYIEKQTLPEDGSRAQKPATVNRRTTLLRQAFRLAMRRHRISSMPEIPRLRENNVRRGFFEKPQFEALVKHLPDYLQGFVEFDYLVGWRRSEITSLGWADVDMLGRVIRLPDSKNGEGRTLALEGELWNIIIRQWTLREYNKPDGTIGISALVFHREGRHVGDFRKSWRAACKAAEVAGKLFHDFRRTAARNMIRGGVNETVAMAITGHKTRSIFDRYNIVSEDDLRDAMRKTQNYLARAPKKAQITPFGRAKKAAAS